MGWLHCLLSLPPDNCLSEAALPLLPGRGCPSLSIARAQSSPSSPQAQVQIRPVRVALRSLARRALQSGKSGWQMLGDIVELGPHRAIHTASDDLGAAVLAGPSCLWMLPGHTAHCGLNSTKLQADVWVTDGCERRVWPPESGEGDAAGEWGGGLWLSHASGGRNTCGLPSFTGGPGSWMRQLCGSQRRRGGEPAPQMAWPASSGSAVWPQTPGLGR